MHKIAFDTFALNDNKYQLELHNYLCAYKGGSVESGLSREESEEYLAHKTCSSQLSAEAHIATWEYLSKSEIASLLEIDKKSEIRKFIECKLQNKLKGSPKIIFRELMYTVLKFCKRSNLNLEQTGALMSEFYLTHSFFTNSLDIGAEKLYYYFKNLQLCHSLPFPPISIKLFSLHETKNIMKYFCRLYLRNLPIIRQLSLPNFTLKVNHPLEREVHLGKMKKGKKNKKGKKKKKKK